MSQLDSRTVRTTLSDQDVLAWPPTGQGNAVFLSMGDLHGILTERFLAGSRMTGIDDEESVIVRLFEPLVDLSDGWDGYGALAPRVDSLQVAARFVLDLVEPGLPALIRFPLPDVMASVTGGVLVEWQADVVDLLLDFQPNGPISVLVRLGDSEEEGELADLRESTLKAIVGLASSV